MFNADMTAMNQVMIELDPQMQAVLGLILTFVMFSVALGLQTDHFKQVIKDPVDVIKGTLVQVVGLPAMTVGLIHLLQLPASIALGLIIVASCPGGNVSNFFCKISGANVAYSVTLSAISSVIAMVMIPVSVLFWGSLYDPINDLLKMIELDRMMFFLRTVMMLGIPLALGMIVAHYAPVRAATIQRVAVPLSMLMLLALVVVASWDNITLFAKYAAVIMTVVIAHNVAAFGLGALASKLLLKDKAKRRSLVFEVGLQNTGLALVILLAEFDGLGGATLITATWGIWHFVTGFLLAAFYRWKG